MDPVDQEVLLKRYTRVAKISWTVIAVVCVVVAVVLIGKVASATEDPQPILVESGCFQEWYVNPDEGDRLPEQVEAGFLFQPADLVHHVAGFPLDDLGTGGAFTADPSPDDNFRFSVEIINADMTGYATLHWNPVTDKWFIGGADASLGQYTNEEADPETFIGKLGRFGEIKADSMVMSFGVGYTKNPPGTIETIVSSVIFAGVTYDLTCALEPVPTATLTPSPSPVVTTTAATTPPVMTTTTVPVTTTTVPVATTTSATCVDLNTGTRDQLISINHIGPVYADAAIALRPFNSIDELAEVSGIGLPTVAKIKASGEVCAIATLTPASGALPVTGLSTSAKVYVLIGIALMALGVFLLVGLWLRNRQARG